MASGVQEFRSTPKWAQLLPWAALVAAVVLGLLAFVVINSAITSTPIPAASWSNPSGFLHYSEVPKLSRDADSNENPQNSPYMILENGKPLGPAHSAHAQIIAEGHGMFSHWQNGFYISASDNSDPATNGRIYSYYRTTPPNPTLPIGLFAVAGLFFLVSVGAFGMRMLAAMRSGRASAPAGLLSGLLTLISLAMALFIVWSVAGIDKRIVLDTSKAAHTNGFMYFMPMPQLENMADSNPEPQRSPFRVFENGVELSTPHCAHAIVASQGHGCYSHFSTGFALSASDNTDVTANGRTYEIIQVVRPPLWLGVLLAAAWAAVFAFDVRRRSRETGRGSGAVSALKHAGLFVLPIVTLLAPLLSTLMVGASNTLDLADALMQVRTATNWVVAFGVALAAAPILVWPDRRGLMVAGLRIAGGALLVLMILYGILDRDYGLANQSALIAWIWMAALAAALAVRVLLPAVRARGMEVFERLDLNSLAGLRLVMLVTCALTLLQVLPDVLHSWDQSGWMDSTYYDRMGHDIARGIAPAGDGRYAPVYQYGLGLIYWTFGHFFFVQQIVNMVLAMATTACLCGAAWLFFRNIHAVALAGLFAAHWEIVHHATLYTQIESWYVPLFSLSLLAAGYYFSRRTILSVVLLALAGALLFATRQQGAFHVAALGLAILFAFGLTWTTRIRQLVIYGAVVAAVGILPWSMRNYAVEGRFSPSSGQAIETLAWYNDPRVPFHGIRYWLAGDVENDWNTRYPDPSTRYRAMQAWYTDRLIHHTDYFIEAAPWRTAVFYGLLPTSLIYGDTTFADLVANPWPHIRGIFAFWAPILASLLGLAFAFRSRPAWYLGLLIPANFVVAWSVGFAEARLCYPVMLLHMLLALAIVSPFSPQLAAAAAPRPATQRSSGRWLVISATAIAAIVATHVFVGRTFMYRELKSATYQLAPEVVIDETLPEVTLRSGQIRVNGLPQQELEPGKRYRAKLVVSNQQLAPRVAGAIPGIKTEQYKPGSVQYFEALEGGISLGLRYDGVVALRPLKELTAIDSEITVEAVTAFDNGPSKITWARVDKARVIKVQR